MQYPLISEYIEAIRFAEDNFDKLSNLRPVLDGNGIPVMSSGNFAVVFKMQDIETGKMYAVKCFTREQEEREERYREITKVLEQVKSPYFVSAHYYDKELFVDTSQSDETEFPVLVMDWVEGATLSSFLNSISRDIRSNTESWTQEEEKVALFELRCLPSNFVRMALWLIKQPFAHGDIKPDNIIIKPNGTFVLIDYDGMFVPSMKGMNKIYTGTPNFRNPLSTHKTLNKKIDNYAISVIALSLYILSLDPHLIEKFNNHCVISDKEAFNLHNHWMFSEDIIMNDPGFQQLLSLYLHTLSTNELNEMFFTESIKDLIYPREYDIFQTKVNDDELTHYWEDDFGVRYSLDGKKVLSASKDLTNIDYSVREGVIIICNKSFQGVGLKSIKLPNSVLSIGDRAFANNDNMEYCNVPSSIRYIYENNPWGGCFNITKMDCYSPFFQIKDGILYSSDFKILYGIIYRAEKIVADFRTRTICSNAFWSRREQFNNSIKHITLINVSEIGSATFHDCKSATFDIIHPISDLASRSFEGCESLFSFDLSEIETIPERAFANCKNLKDIKFSPKLVSIGSHAFEGCTSLTVVDIPMAVSFISDSAFAYCTSIYSFNVDDKNKHYCSIDGVLYNKNVTKLIKFPAGKPLKYFTLPDTICEIGNEAFAGCNTIERITCSYKIIRFGDKVFDDCKALNKCYIYLDDRTDAKSAWNLGEFLSSLKNVPIDIKQNGFSLIKKSAEMNNAYAQWFLARYFKYGYNGNKDIEQYLFWLKRSAENKGIQAMEELAKEYMFGNILSKNYAKAYELLLEVEKMGRFSSNNKGYLALLGWLYEHGIEVKKDVHKAVKYYTEGAIWKDCDAEYNLARCYKGGIGIEKNIEKAKEYYIRAKEHNHGMTNEALERF